MITTRKITIVTIMNLNFQKHHKNNTFCYIFMLKRLLKENMYDFETRFKWFMIKLILNC